MAKVWDPFWIRAIRTEFVPQINAIVDVLQERLLPNIETEDIEAESERISEEKWEEYNSMSGTGDEDPADFADLAESAGVSHLNLMLDIRQGMLNLFAVALYHAFEQQIMWFHRKNVLNIDEENKQKLFKLSEFKQRMEELGVKLEDLYSWQKINDELRLVANTVKHAEGGSSQQLRQKRPGMFRRPLLSSSTLLSSPAALPVFQPLIGDGLYVSIDDIEDYRDHLVRFWQELADSLESSNQRRRS